MSAPKLLEPSRHEFLKGLTDGRKTAAGCVDAADAIWHQKVVFDNLRTSRPYYVDGFVAAFAERSAS